MWQDTECKFGNIPRFLPPGTSVFTVKVTGSPHGTMGVFLHWHHRATAVRGLPWNSTLLVFLPPPWPLLVCLLQAHPLYQFLPTGPRAQSNSYDGHLKAWRLHHIYSKDFLQAENHEVFHLLFICHDTHTAESSLPSLGWVQVCRCRSRCTGVPGMATGSAGLGCSLVPSIHYVLINVRTVPIDEHTAFHP